MLTMVGFLCNEGKVGILFYLTFLEKGVKMKMKHVIVYINLVMLYIYSENGSYQSLIFL